MSIVGIFENLVISEVVIPIGPRSVTGVTRTVSVPRIVALIIRAPHKKGILYLFQVVFALHFIGLLFGFGQSGE